MMPMSESTVSEPPLSLGLATQTSNSLQPSTLSLTAATNPHNQAASSSSFASTSYSIQPGALTPGARRHIGLATHHQKTDARMRRASTSQVSSCLDVASTSTGPAALPISLWSSSTSVASSIVSSSAVGCAIGDTYALPPGSPPPAAPTKFVAVHAIDRRHLHVVVTSKTRVNEVWQCVCSALSLAEFRLFGLAIRQPADGFGDGNARHEFFFLDPARKLEKYAPRPSRLQQLAENLTSHASSSSSVSHSSQPPRPVIVLHLRVRCHVETCALIRCPLSLAYYYRSLRANLADQWSAAAAGSVPMERCWILAGLALRADEADGTVQDVETALARPEDFLPAWVLKRCSYDQARADLRRVYEEVRLQRDPDDARKRFCAEAMRPPFAVNSHLYAMRRDKLDTVDNAALVILPNGLEVWSVAPISPNGMQDERTWVRSVAWPRCTRLAHDKRKLSIQTSDGILTVYAQSDGKARYLMEFCRLVHQQLLSWRSAPFTPMFEAATQTCDSLFVDPTPLAALPSQADQGQQLSRASSKSTSGVASEEGEHDVESVATAECNASLDSGAAASPRCNHASTNTGPAQQLQTSQTATQSGRLALASSCHVTSDSQGTEGTLVASESESRVKRTSTDGTSSHSADDRHRRSSDSATPAAAATTNLSPPPQQQQLQQQHNQNDNSRKTDEEEEGEEERDATTQREVVAEEEEEEVEEEEEEEEVEIDDDETPRWNDVRSTHMQSVSTSLPSLLFADGTGRFLISNNTAAVAAMPRTTAADRQHQLHYQQAQQHYMQWQQQQQDRSLVDDLDPVFASTFQQQHTHHPAMQTPSGQQHSPPAALYRTGALPGQHGNPVMPAQQRRQHMQLQHRQSSLECGAIASTLRDLSDATAASSALHHHHQQQQQQQQQQHAATVTRVKSMPPTTQHYLAMGTTNQLQLQMQQQQQQSHAHLHMFRPPPSYEQHTAMAAAAAAAVVSSQQQQQQHHVQRQHNHYPYEMQQQEMTATTTYSPLGKSEGALDLASGLDTARVRAYPMLRGLYTEWKQQGKLPPNLNFGDVDDDRKSHVVIGGGGGGGGGSGASTSMTAPSPYQHIRRPSSCHDLTSLSTTAVTAPVPAPSIPPPAPAAATLYGHTLQQPLFGSTNARPTTATLLPTIRPIPAPHANTTSALSGGAWYPSTASHHPAPMTTVISKQQQQQQQQVAAVTSLPPPPPYPRHHAAVLPPTLAIQ